MFVLHMHEGIKFAFFTSLFFQRAKYCPMFFSFCFPINNLNRTIYNITGCRKYLYLENLNKDIKVVYVQGSHFFAFSYQCTLSKFKRLFGGSQY